MGVYFAQNMRQELLCSLHGGPHTEGLSISGMPFDPTDKAQEAH